MFAQKMIKVMVMMLNITEDNDDEKHGEVALKVNKLVNGGNFLLKRCLQTISRNPLSLPDIR